MMIEEIAIPLPSGLLVADDSPVDARFYAPSEEALSQGYQHEGMFRWVRSQPGKPGALYIKVGPQAWIKFPLQQVKGDAATIEPGLITIGPQAKVENVGTKQNAIFNFTLPPGPTGKAAVINSIQIMPVAWTEQPSVQNLGTNQLADLVFYMPQAKPGDKGEKGDAFAINGRGSFDNRNRFNGPEFKEGFSYLVIDPADQPRHGLMYFKNANNTWTAGVGFTTLRGWTPRLSLQQISDTRIVLAVIGWLGGDGPEPELPVAGMFVGPAGFTSDATLAVNLYAPGPAGQPGQQGRPFFIDEFGPDADKILYDERAFPFNFYAVDTRTLYQKMPLTHAWASGIDMTPPPAKLTNLEARQLLESLPQGQRLHKDFLDGFDDETETPPAPVTITRLEYTKYEGQFQGHDIAGIYSNEEGGSATIGSARNTATGPLGYEQGNGNLAVQTDTQSTQLLWATTVQKGPYYGGMNWLARTFFDQNTSQVENIFDIAISGERPAGFNMTGEGFTFSVGYNSSFQIKTDGLYFNSQKMESGGGVARWTYGADFKAGTLVSQGGFYFRVVSDLTANQFSIIRHYELSPGSLEFITRTLFTSFEPFTSGYTNNNVVYLPLSADITALSVANEQTLLIGVDGSAPRWMPFEVIIQVAAGSTLYLTLDPNAFAGPLPVVPAAHAEQTWYHWRFMPIASGPEQGKFQWLVSAAGESYDDTDLANRVGELEDNHIQLTTMQGMVSQAQSEAAAAADAASSAEDSATIALGLVNSANTAADNAAASASNAESSVLAATQQASQSAASAASANTSAQQANTSAQQAVAKANENNNTLTTHEQRITNLENPQTMTQGAVTLGIFNFDYEWIKSQSSVGTNLVFANAATVIANAGIGSWCRLVLDSRNAGDTLTGWMAASGATTATVNGLDNMAIVVDQVGFAFQPGVRNDVEIEMIDLNRFEVFINPKV